MTGRWRRIDAGRDNALVVGRLPGAEAQAEDGAPVAWIARMPTAFRRRNREPSRRSRRSERPMKAPASSLQHRADTHDHRRPRRSPVYRLFREPREVRSRGRGQSLSASRVCGRPVPPTGELHAREVEAESTFVQCDVQVGICSSRLARAMRSGEGLDNAKRSDAGLVWSEINCTAGWFDVGGSWRWHGRSS